MVVLENNQVDARSPKISVTSQICVGNLIRSRVWRANDVGVPMGMRTQGITGQLGVNGQLDVNLAEVIQSALLNLGSMSLNIIGNRGAK